MSEETTPSKKAARKSVRKKSAAKRSSPKSSPVEAETEEQSLPLVENESEGSESSSTSRAKGREPKTKVRDARREMADEPIPEEASAMSSEDRSSFKGSDKSSRPEKSKEPKEHSGDPEPSSGNERRGRGRGRRERTEKREPRKKTSIDSKDLAKKAWKIFQSEVTEEGLALVDDNGLRDYARSSFNAARLFLEEKERIVAREKQAKAESKKRKGKGENEKGDD